MTKIASSVHANFGFFRHSSFDIRHLPPRTCCSGFSIIASLLSVPRAASALDKITLRAALAAFCSFLLAVLAGPRCIAWLRRRFREPIKCDSPEIRNLHQAKESTPTMGGLFIVAGLLAGVLIFGDWRNRYLWIAVLLAVGLTLVGAVDDLVKLRRRPTGFPPAGNSSAKRSWPRRRAVLLYGKQAALPDGLRLRLPWSGAGISLGCGSCRWRSW